jgi:type II secretory pathway component PulF
MHCSYAFTAKTRHGKPVSGVIDAESTDLAYHRIKKIGFVSPEVHLHLLETLKSWLGIDIDRRELARFYATVGQRMKNEGSLVSALDGAQDYVMDERLKSAIAMMRAAVSEGNKPHEAMAAAGFDLREAMVVRALAEGGDMAQAFKDLAKDIKDSHELTSRISATFRMFRFTLIGVWLFIPFLFLSLAPKMLKFFKTAGKANIKIPSSVQVFYDFVVWTQQEPLLALMLYLAVPFSVIWFLRSKTARRLTDHIKMVRDLSVRSEHARVWSGYALMYRAGIPPAEICETLAKTTKRDETCQGLLKFAKRLKGGEADTAAIAATDFPRFAISGYTAAKHSNALEEGLLMFADTLKEDVAMITQRLADLGEIGSKLLLAVVVFFVFYVVLYPMLGPIIASL